MLGKFKSAIESNNLSSGNKFSPKNYDSKTIFNIVEPKHIRNDLRVAAAASGEPILTSFSNHYERQRKQANFESGPSCSAALDARPSENDAMEVWDCQYCTLENPFWKIVCSACERIRPYGSATRKSSQTDNFLVEEVKLRPKSSIKRNNSESSATKRFSTDGSAIQPYAVGPSRCDDDDTKSKRTSLVFAPKGTVNTLEMEKERLRAVIREMNHRAMTERYPLEKPSNVDNTNSRKHEALNLDNGNMNKNIYKEIVASNLLLTDDAKANVAKERNGEVYYDFIGNLDTYCDRAPLGGTMRRLEEDIFRPRTSQGNRNPPKIDKPNDLQ